MAALDEAATAEERLPLVMTALLASGIPILDETGQPVPFTPAPQGPALEAWQVHALAAVDPTRHAQMTVGSLAEMFIEDLTPADAEGFRGAFSLDLRTAAFGAGPQGQLWAWLVAARDPRGATLAMASSESEDLVLDGLQLELLLARLAADLWRASIDQQSGDLITSATYTKPGPQVLGPSAAPLPCRYTETEDKIVTAAEETESVALGKLIEWLEDKGVAGMGALAKAAMVADIASFVLPYLLLTIDFELASPPLVRTKSTGQDGERRQLAATLRFDTGDLQLVNCFRLMFASAGMTFSVPADGPLANGSVSWEPNGGFERVQFYGDPVHSSTDDMGISIIGIEGRKQKTAVPATAGRVNTEASVFLAYAVKNISLGQDLWDAASGGGSPLNVALEGLARAKWSSASFTFPVVDWGERWLAEIVIEETSSTGSIYFSWAGEMGVDSEGLVVGTGAGTVAIVGKLCVDIPPDGHSQAVDWRIDGEHTFAFDGYREDGVLHLLLPNTGQAFRQSGDPGPCQFDAAFEQAGAQTMLVVLGTNPIQLSTEPGTQTIPFGEGTNLTIRLEPISD